MDLQGKTMLVIGAGISGFAAAKLAKGMGARVILSDAKMEADIAQDFTELRQKGMSWFLVPRRMRFWMVWTLCLCPRRFLCVFPFCRPHGSAKFPS